MMADSFFGFETEFPSSTLGKRKLEEELLTDNVDEEEEYDALNDETFGGGADEGDWEEDHDKFAAEMVGKEQQSSRSDYSPLFDSSVCDGDETQQEIVSKSISQLGLEDDLDDPAIMTVGRSRNIWPTDPVFRSSPPPPAILDPELCGSPKTHSIWSTNHSSTPVKDSGIGSLFQTLSNSSNTYQHSASPLSPNPSSIFSSPLAQKAWTLEEIERNFLSSGPQPKPSGNEWTSTPSHVDKGSQGSGFSGVQSPIGFQSKGKEIFSGDVSDLLHLPETPPVHSGAKMLDEVEEDILLKRPAPTVEEVERHLKSGAVVAQDRDMKGVRWPQPQDPRLGFPGPIARRPVGRGYPTLGLRGPIVPPVFPRILGNPVPMPMAPKGKDPRLGAIYDRMPLSPMFYPTSVLDPQRMNLAFIGPGRIVRHPLLQDRCRGKPVFRFGDPHLMRPFLETNGYEYAQQALPANRNHQLLPDHDEYAGLMTQKEKEWLLRIQLMLVQTDNPYVEDFYYSTYLARKCAQEALKNNSGSKSSPKLILPERGKTESKAYVPAQFEGSLGKLQAVSVNFPRKVLDISVKRPVDDEEGQVVTNQSLMKYRRLLLDIENMYNYLLEIDDEEKRILALPDDAHQAHQDNIVKLANKIMAGLGCESVTSDDTFQNIITVRKGRNLAFRSFQVFSKEQQLCFVKALFRCFSHFLRKDQSDLVLSKYIDLLLDFIRKLSLSDLVLLGESLENLPNSDTVITSGPVREKSNFISSFKNKVAQHVLSAIQSKMSRARCGFQPISGLISDTSSNKHRSHCGTSLVCCMLQHAEDLYSSGENVDSEAQARWAKVILHIVDIICALPDSSFVPPSWLPNDLLIKHFQRFAVDRDKFEVLKEKVNIFQSKGTEPENSV